MANILFLGNLNQNIRESVIKEKKRIDLQHKFSNHKKLNQHHVKGINKYDSDKYNCM